jgi:hypothetical protein
MYHLPLSLMAVFLIILLEPMEFFLSSGSMADFQQLCLELPIINCFVLRIVPAYKLVWERSLSQAVDKWHG